MYRRLSTIGFIFVFCLLLGIVKPSCAAVSSYQEDYIIGSIDVVFYTSDGSSKYTSKIAAKEEKTSVINKLGSKVGALALPERIDADIAVLKELYGDADFTVKKVKQGKGYQIVFMVYEQPQINTIITEGVSYANKSAVLERAAEFNDKKMSAKDFFDLERNIKRFYLDKGYSDVAVTAKAISSSGSEPQEAPTSHPLPQTTLLIDVYEGSKNFIKKITLQGIAPGKEYTAVRNVMKSRTYRTLLPSSKAVGIPNTQLLEDDKLSILTAIRALGYQDATVENNVRYEPDGAVVVFTVNKGTRYVLSAATFEGNTLLATEIIATTLKQFIDKPFSDDLLRQIGAAVGELYFNRGFIKAEIDPQVSKLPGSNKMLVSIAIKEGKQYKIGAVMPINMKNTAPWVINKTISLVPGEIFTAKAIRESHRALAQTRWFSDIDIRHQIAEDRDDVCDIFIDLTEKKFGDCNFTFGLPAPKYSIMLNVPNFRAQGLLDFLTSGELKKSNFVGFGEDFALSFACDDSYKLSLKWEKPWVFNTNFRFGIASSLDAISLSKLLDIRSEPTGESAQSLRLFVSRALGSNCMTQLSIGSEFSKMTKLFSQFMFRYNSFIPSMKPGLPVGGLDVSFSLQANHLLPRTSDTVQRTSLTAVGTVQLYVNLVEDLATFRWTLKGLSGVPIGYDLDKFTIGGSSSDKGSSSLILRGLEPNRLLLENGKPTYAGSVALSSLELVFMPTGVIKPILFLDACIASTKPLLQSASTVIPIIADTPLEEDLSINRQQAFAVTIGGVVETEAGAFSIQMGVGYPVYYSAGFDQRKDFEQVIFNLGAAISA